MGLVVNVCRLSWTCVVNILVFRRLTEHKQLDEFNETTLSRRALEKGTGLEQWKVIYAASGNQFEQRGLLCEYFKRYVSGIIQKV